MNGIYLVGGFIIYTMGELITNPKFTEYFDFISDEVDKSTYMGLLFFSNLIGYPIGALLGGYLYGKFGEKASLAKQYLIDNYGIDVNLNDAYQKLIEVSNSNEIETTTLLWETYSPFISLLPFVIIGVISLVGLLIYSSLIRNK
jgi:MFS family permease